MRSFIVLVLISCFVSANGQQSLNIKITNRETKAPIAASIKINETLRGYIVDSTGVVSILFAGNGNYTLITTAVGYNKEETKISIPYSGNVVAIELEPGEEELEEVIVQSTRTSRTIANVPTRVETIEFEEIDEKNNMRPANVAMLLHESTGIQVQQTSATSGNASIRIQGLDGRYTQLLKDGFATLVIFPVG